MSRIVIFLTLFLLESVVHSADLRLALVIGNSKYTEFGTLENPVKDAKGMSQALKEMGYTTKLVLDADESTMRREVKRFAAASQGADVALVYYAGHGSQVGGENYLLPVDLELPKVDTDIQLSSIKVDDVINSLKSKVKIFLLDACRDNPVLAKNLVKGRGSYRGGLAPVNSTIDVSSNEGVFIAYSTDSGNTASDGSGNQNSPFTAALLKNIKAPVSIDDMFSMVTREVKQQTGNKQRPYKYASLEGIFCIPMECGKLSKDSRILKNDNSTAQIGSNDLQDRFISADKWTFYYDDGDSLYFFDINSIESQEKNRKVNLLRYRYKEPDEAKDIFPLDSYASEILVFGCLNNKFGFSQFEIFNNKAEILGTYFYAPWRKVKLEGELVPNANFDVLKKIVCTEILPQKIDDENLEKFFLFTYDTKVGGATKKGILSYYFDTKSIKKFDQKYLVNIKILSSIPESLAGDEKKYRDFTEIANKYKNGRSEGPFLIDCKKNYVEYSALFNYSEALKSPIGLTLNRDYQIAQGGYIRALFDIVCKV